MVIQRTQQTIRLMPFHQIFPVSGVADPRTPVIKVYEVRPATYLSSSEDLVLAKIWDNEEDDIFDTL